MFLTHDLYKTQHFAKKEISVTSTTSRFSFWKYMLFVLLQAALLLVSIRLLLPGVWNAQIAAGSVTIILVFLGIHLFNCFAEWAFHRYVLHAVCAKWLQRFAVSHRLHHNLTPIRLRRDEAGKELKILNQYPIESEAQLESSVFPKWALVAFWGLFTPFLVGLQLWFPRTPFLLSGYLAITWSLACYETFHHVEHLPFEWWRRRMANRNFGRLWMKAYGFHHMHHANIRCNEAISGFFGLPLADWAFGTYNQPRKIFLNGDIASSRDFVLLPPRSFVQRLDRLVRRREARLSSVAS